MHNHVQAKNHLAAVLAVAALLCAGFAVWHSWRYEQAEDANLDPWLARITEAERQTSDLEGAVRALTERLDAAEAAGGRGNLREATVIMASTALRDAASTGAPYRGQLDLLRSVLPESPAYAVLDLHADAGVPSVAMLRTQFAAISHRLDNEARMADADEATGRFRAMFRSLVVIRKVDGSAVGNTLVARIERSLEAHDLRNAVREAETLGGEPAKTAGAWLAAARDRLAVDEALASMIGSAVAAVRSGGRD
ncbi:hypothetical protein FACS1894186_3550 [Alphaproteobacteria bacterium]|nr:hypothetical protein FACS1894186_3550 [Alphaproteobacteria bacterium]